jgi:hypothetical protein
MPCCRGRSKCTARWVLLWTLLLLLAFQLTAGTLQDCLVPISGDPAYAAKVARLRARLAEAPDHALVLMLGSSRTLVGIDAGRLHTAPDGRPAVVFNFGFQGAGPLLDLICLQRLLDAGIRPDFVFVEILPLLLNQPHAHPVEEDWLKGERLRFDELVFLRRYHSEPTRLLQQWAKARWLPGPAQRTLFGEQPADDDWDNWMDGYGWNHHFTAAVTPEYREQVTTRALQQYSDAVGPFHLAPGPVQALHDLLDRCRQEHIRVTLLLMPEGRAFQSLYTPAARTGLNDFLAHLFLTRLLPLIDARNWIAEDGFWDSHHLLPAAAAAFTERLEREIIELSDFCPPRVPLASASNAKSCH